MDIEKDLDNNGYDIVPDLNQQKAADAVAAATELDALSQFLSTQVTAAAPADEQVKIEQVVLQEPDSTTNENENKKLNDHLTNIFNQVKEEEKKLVEKITPKPAATTTTTTTTSTNKPTTTTTTAGNGCSFCSYGERLLELIYFHPKVDEVLQWKDPKISGAILAVLLISLISIATFSLLSIVGFLLLATMTVIGGYRLYVAILLKIKGQSDDLLSKYVSLNLRIPKEDLQHVLNLVETHGNEYLNKLKQIVLWENITTSGIAFAVSYVVYSIGCAFNTITLLILSVIVAFTWPKVYSMYKVQIDQVVKQAHDQVLDVISKIKEKVPFLNKKKLQ